MFIDISALDPIAFSLGPFHVRWYALAYLAGFLLGWRYCVYLLKKTKSMRPNAEDIETFLTWAILGVIIGGRIGYVVFYNLPYYAHNPIDAFKVWQGGMSFHGGMLGVFVAMVLYTVRHKISFWRLSDVICAAAPIGLFFGRLSNFVNMELYGRITDKPWGVVFPNAGSAPRHPSQLYEAVLEGALLFVVLLILYRVSHAKAGLVTGVFLIGYGASRAFVEMFRAPDEHIGLLGGVISMGQVLSLPMIVIGLAVVVMRYRAVRQND